MIISAVDETLLEWRHIYVSQESCVYIKGNRIITESATNYEKISETLARGEGGAIGRLREKSEARIVVQQRRIQQDALQLLTAVYPWYSFRRTTTSSISTNITSVVMTVHQWVHRILRSFFLSHLQFQSKRERYFPLHVCDVRNKTGSALRVCVSLQNFGKTASALEMLLRDTSLLYCQACRV